MAEFPNLGKHCTHTNCQQLDFLPFECVYCKQIYCLEHKFPDDHSCTQFVQKENYEPFTGTKSYCCDFTECDRRELMQIICQHCHRNFCLTHRHQQDHSCPNIEIKETPVYKTAEHVQKIIDSKNQIPKKTPARKKQSKTAAKVALMKMKMKATGDKGIPQEDRVFLEVYLPLGGGVKSKPLFFSKTWSVGRVIDSAADKSSITNTNNTASEKKLRLFSADDGHRYQIDRNLEGLLSEDSLLNGGNVILEYVTSDCVLLSDLNLYLS